MTIARRKAAHAKRDTGKSDLNPHDALVLLAADHNEIDKLAREFERHRKTAGHVEKGKLALRIACPDSAWQDQKEVFILPPKRCSKATTRNWASCGSSRTNCGI
jgi:hypothetical protein